MQRRFLAGTHGVAKHLVRAAKRAPQKQHLHHSQRPPQVPQLRQPMLQRHRRARLRSRGATQPAANGAVVAVGAVAARAAVGVRQQAGSRRQAQMQMNARAQPAPALTRKPPHVAAHRRRLRVRAAPCRSCRPACHPAERAAGCTAHGTGVSLQPPCATWQQGPPLVSMLKRCQASRRCRRRRCIWRTASAADR